MEIKNICVVGGGRMGRQIGLCAAIHGFNCKVYDVSDAACADIIKWENEYLVGRIEKKKMTEAEVEATKGRFTVTPKLEEAVKGVDCVIECIWEQEAIKRDLFKKLDTLVGENVILATNSSYMVSSKFADCVRNPARLANAHFYNPALVMKLVEVVQGPHTSEETAQALMDFCIACEKKPIWMKKEIEGFAANRIIRAIQTEARFLVENGYLTPQEVDTACEFGLNHPMGPFRLGDLTGNDLTFDIMKEKYAKTGVKPDCYDLFEQMVKEGRLGRKTGRGFYDYN